MSSILALVCGILAVLLSNSGLHTLAQISGVSGIVFLVMALATSVRKGGRDE